MRRGALLLVFLLVLCGCEKNEGSKPEVKSEMRTYKVTSQEVQAYLDATGTIQPDLEGGAKIISPVGGSISRILVHIGDPVKKGTPLIVLTSPDVADTYANYLSTLSQLKQAERIYQLNKQLFEVGAVTKNDLLISQSNVEQQKALSDGLKKKLDMYGVSCTSGHFEDILTIQSPMDGYAAEIEAHIGDRFDSSTPLMTIAHPDRIMVVANIYDTNIAGIVPGQDVTFVTDVIPNTTFNGKVKYISHVEDADVKTIKVYIGLKDSINTFKHNMFLRIRILGEQIKRPIIPTAAMIYKDSKFSVQVKHNDSFEMKEIRPVKELSDKLMAVEGISEGEEIAYSAIELEKP
jgi:cobalt-zinc-cadmium efflux system membrane fusion protein